MPKPPSIDTNKISANGYINQRAALERRRALVERLSASALCEGVILIDDGDSRS